MSPPSYVHSLLSEELAGQRQELLYEQCRSFVAEHKKRRSLNIKHPIWDFLFSYYSLSPGHLLKYHPGFGTGIEGTRWIRSLRKARGYHHDDSCIWLGSEQLIARKYTLEFVVSYLQSVGNRPAQFGCFGLHEWAMVYRDSKLRHQAPLRLGEQRTNEVTESLPLKCTHYDAYRFFTEEAKKRTHVLTRDNQINDDQPGCIHVSMDLYKWASKLYGLIDSQLVAKGFQLAKQARLLDMRSSPYDLTEYGYDPIAIETTQGRAQYYAEQKKLTAAAAELRQEILDTAEHLLLQLNHILC